MNAALLALLRSPKTGAELVCEGAFLKTRDGRERYPIQNGIALLLPQCDEGARDA